MLKIPGLAVLDLEWVGSIPQAPWSPGFQLVGGSDTSLAGVPAAWMDRDVRLLELRYRFYESEWPELRAVIWTAQRYGSVLTVTPDVASPLVFFQTYLHAPELGKEVKPDHGQHPGEKGLTIVVRSVDGSALEPMYFA